MNDFYEEDVCMKFTNEEVCDYLIEPLRKYSDLNIRLLSSNSIELCENAKEKIGFVCFDGEKENFYIRFDDNQTSIFISDEGPLPQKQFTFNEEFMFIDESNKQYYTSSDTYGNVVYEGMLRNKTHKKILGLFCAFIILLKGAKKISVKKTIISKEDYEYPKYEYIVSISNESDIKKSIKYENILFCINE